MKKPRNKFDLLSQADRQLILDLCSSHPYEDAAGILAGPRSAGGLDLVVSTSALCRFYTGFQPEPDHAVLAQYAAAVAVGHQKNPNTFLAAIQATVEARILKSLKGGKALADLEKEFRILKTTHAVYVRDAKLAAYDTKAARGAYQAHLKRCVSAPEDDFIPNDQLADPALSDLALEPTDLERDLEKTRVQIARDEERDLAFEAARSALLRPRGLRTPAIPPITSNSTSLASPPAADHTRATQPGTQTQPNPFNFAKKPVIPHIAPNSTAPGTHFLPPSNSNFDPASPTVSPATSKPVPIIRSQPKLGRNDPCSCGSGHKYKKCCLLKAHLQRPVGSAHHSA